jgi:hypothetical protein
MGEQSKLTIMALWALKLKESANSIPLNRLQLKLLIVKAKRLKPN